MPSSSSRCAIFSLSSTERDRPSRCVPSRSVVSYRNMFLTPRVAPSAECQPAASQMESDGNARNRLAGATDAHGCDTNPWTECVNPTLLISYGDCYTKARIEVFPASCYYTALIPDTGASLQGSPRAAAWGFLLLGGQLANRVCFLVDGFNVYHSVVAAQAGRKGASMKWLDLRALCESYLSSIGGGATLQRVFYFSAYMDWIPDKAARHATYVAALRATGVEVQLHRFKEKEVWCKVCKKAYVHHEEKETDVAIAVKLLELCAVDACETIVIVTGDTDLAPAIRTAKVLWGSKQIWVLFPFARHNAELKLIAHGHLKMKARRYLSYQLPNPVKVSATDLIWKPTTW